ncbi:YadA domain-containing structural protein [Prochlorococcus phage P-SSM7]|uniref:YadA domain-containing structural protein n=1 Tax=Prochlorococcus phage P-SSM7 TaxID=445688 RepID=E3SNL6_9CAUD|nr:structural protein [Prochlorococcus phage P-SSM7]ADO99005.1 YadA domain-containing structural protein [Prochlorococcus phage P-SSM7]
MANRIQLRRGNGQEWQNSNPILAQGELGIELNTGRFKIGDGVTPWNTLRYERPIESTSNTANTLVQRDNDGNFSAATVTATIIGNASTASRLASSRQIQLIGDVGGSQIFDGSENISLSATLDLLSTLPHHDNTETSSGTYTKVTVDAKGRVTNASNPTTLADYNLNGTVEGSSAQAYDLDLVALAGLTTTGFISRTASNTMATRTITGTAGKINVNNGGGLAGNPTLDLATTTVVDGDYNTESLTSVSGVGSNSEPFGTETVNAVKFSVDDRGRLTSATNVPIATATQGTTAAAYNAATVYVRGDQITNASKLYQAIAGIAAGAGAPTHSDTSDAGSWRHLGAAASPQKGLASFDQEDFDVTAGGHVTMALGSIDNDQLQNSRISFADGNTKEDFSLDQELTATTGYRGFNYLNYLKVNDTSGNLLFGANNTGDGGAGEVDINARLYFSDADITLDGAVAQTLDKTGDGNLTFQTTQDSSSARTLSILATNAGTGASGVVVTAENTVTITASDAAGKVQVEDMYFQGDYIASSAATMILDPGDDRAVSGKVQIMGDLQVDGTTTTINSTITTLDDPIITLGGDTAPGSDDNKDRGVEFRYYDTQARVGFFGYDDSAADLGGHTGAFSFIYDATNTSEVFSGTDAGIIAGNLKLTTGTASTTNTTGDLVVAGGAGITGDVNIGGSVDIDTNLGVTGTSLFTDEVVIKGASKNFILKDGSNNAKITAVTTSGNLTMAGILAVTGNVDINSNKFNITAASGNTAIAGTLTVSDETIVKADNKTFKVQTAAGVDKFVVDTDNGDTNSEGKLNVADLVHFESTDEPDILSGAPHSIQNSDYGALRVDGGGYFDKNVLFNGDIFLNGDFNQQEDATENYGLRNYLSVRYKMRAGSVGAYTPSYSNHNTSNLRVFGGAGVNTTLHVGGTGSGEGLFVGKKNSGDTVKFSVLGATGNTDIQGTLDVAGNSEFNGTVDVDGNFAVRSGTTDKFTIASATGNAVNEGELNVKGAVDFDTTLNVDGTATIQDDLIVKSDNKMFKVQTAAAADKFTVDTDNGNTVISGTLQVDGQINVNDSLVIDEANEVFSVQNGSAVAKFEVDTDNGNTNIIGTLTVGDATQINDTFGTSGVNTFTNNTEQTLSGSYAADGSARFSGGIGLAKNLAVGGGARVYGNTELTGTLDLNNSADISGALVTHDNVTITADNKEFAIQNGSAADKFTVDTDNGNTDIRGTLDVGGDVTAESNLTITGNLTVNGTTTTVNSTVTTLDDPIITVGGDTAPASNDGKDRGVEFRYYDGSAKIGFFGYDRSSSQFAFVTDSTNTSEVHAGTDGALRAGSLNLTAAGTALDVDNDANIDGALTVDGQIVSNKSSGAPFSIASTTKVNNLNVDLLDGMTTASANTGSTVVNRDSNGDFAANQITAASSAGAGAGFLGNASTADAWKTARTFTIDGVVSGSVSVDGSAAPTITTTYVDADITALAAMSGTGYVVRTAANTYAQRTLAVTASSGITLTNPDGVSGNTTINVASASTNAANNLVLRDGSGDFAANEITSDLVGNLTGATSTAKDLNPAADSTYDLGTSSVRWQGIFADAANITAITGTLTGTVSSIANHNTADLAEGTNLYYTDERVDDRVNALIVAGTGITKVYDDAAGTYTLTVTQADVNTDTITEGSTNLFTTAARTRTHFTYGTGITHSSGTLSVTQSDINTDNVTEGSTNLFTTAARTRTHFTYGTGITHSSGTLSVTQADIDTDNVTEGSTNLFTTAARTRTHFTYGVGIKLATADLALDFTEFDTDNITEGSTNLYYTQARADARVAAATGANLDLSSKSTTNLSEGTNQYYTEARVQTKLDNAFEQLSAMLNNLATSTTLTLALSGDPTPGAVVTTGVSVGGGGGFTAGTGVATTGGTGSSLTVNTTVVDGAITAAVVNAGGSGYLISDTVTVTNPNAGKVLTLNLATLSGGTGYSSATGVAVTGGSGSSMTADITASAGAITNVTVNNGGTGFAAGETITIANANASGIKTTGNVSAADASRTAGTYTIGASDYGTGGSGNSATFSIVVDGSGAATITVTDDGTGFVVDETITVADAQLGGGGGAALTFDATAIHGNGATVNIATVATNATLTLTDITTMEVGATVTGATSGTTGVVTALGTNQITVDNVDGFFKKGEVVSANDVTTLTISSFS